MSRIPTPAAEHAPEKSRPLLAAVQKQLGATPNMFRIVANSPATLDAYLGFSGAREQSLGDFPARPVLRGQFLIKVAVAVAGAIFLAGTELKRVAAKA